MKKQVLFFIALSCAITINAKTVKLNPGPWEVDNAKYAVWHWQEGGSDGSFSAFMTLSGTTYSTSIDDKSNKLIFVRISSDATAPDWGKKWNQTGNLNYCSGIYTITGWGESDGSWDSCSEEGGGSDPACGSDYYLTGDGTWTGGETWSPTAAKMTSGKIVISALPAGTYTFKITQGCWASNWGNDAINTSCSNISCNGDTDGNAVFSLSAAADVTFTFDGVSICISTESDVPTPTPVTLKTFDTPTPANCGDVMLQAFYYDSNEDKEYGNTKWETLLKNAAETGAYFNMIWLPPSAMSTGGIGYEISSEQYHGDYGYSLKPIKKWTSLKSTKGYLKQTMLPDSLRHYDFDPTLYRRTVKFLKEEDPTHIFIYGEIDPWSSSGVCTWLNCKKKENMRVYVQPRGSHKARINTMPDNMRQEIIDRLTKWLK